MTCQILPADDFLARPQFLLSSSPPHKSATLSLLPSVQAVTHRQLLSEQIKRQ